VQYTPVTVPLVLAAGLSITSAVVAWRQRRGPTELWGAVLQVVLALWAGMMLLTVSLESKPLKELAVLLFLPLIPLLTVSAVAFTCHFTGRSDWLTRRRTAALASFPLFVLLLSLSNSVHGWMIQQPELVSRGSWTVLTYQWGPGFWFLAITSYSLAALYLWWLGKHMLHTRNVYRKLTFVIILSNIGVVGATVPSALQISPYPHFLLVPHVHLVLGFLLVLATGSAKFARLVPVDQLLQRFSSRFDEMVTLARDFIVEEVDNGIIVLDEDDRIVDANGTAQKMLGVDRLVGQELSTVVHTEFITEMGTLEPMLTGQAPVEQIEEAIWIEAGPERRCYDIRVSALGEGDTTAGHVVMMHDITEQKRRETRLREREEELRTQKEALERQNDQLEHQNERLDQFASIVSHDLRNPLTVAEGYIETLEAQVNRAEEAELPIDETMLAEVQHSHKRMEAIIEDALTLAREGKAITETSTVSLGPLMWEAWDNVDTKAAELESAVELDVEGDRNRLLNVFENLFRNAVQHGRADVTVSCRECDAEDTTGFVVADDGPGIPASDLDDVLDHGYTTHSEGTGLGLAIVTDIVRAHGWEISVCNGPDGGAQFEITGIERATVDTASESAAADTL
jgi:PAS domain S-box-containing protein